MLLLDRGGMVTQDAVQIAASGWSVEVLMLLLHRGGMVTQDAVQIAASGGSAEVLMLLLDRGGMITQPIFEKAASECSAETFVLLFEKGGTLTTAVLQATLKNGRFRAEIMNVLLDRHPPFITAEDIPQLLKSAITESLLVTAIKDQLSGDNVIALCERAKSIAIGTRILEAAAANHRFSNGVLPYLSRRRHDVELPEAVFEAAAGNFWGGKEALLLLEARSGYTINTQTVAKAAICKGSLPATRLLLARPRDWSVIKELVICAT
ncbi:hypothetical protein MMC30_008575 [Trapelia coarctata]|nr:hypothetical protein [Trapelia coarctata]